MQQIQNNDIFKLKLNFIMPCDKNIPQGKIFKIKNILECKINKIIQKEMQNIKNV